MQETGGTGVGDKVDRSRGQGLMLQATRKRRGGGGGGGEEMEKKEVNVDLIIDLFPK